MTGMTILEGVLCAVVDGLQLVKILTDENGTKSSMAKVNKQIHSLLKAINLLSYLLDIQRLIKVCAYWH